MITICRNENGLMITGHARAGPYGQDIVCSAVSALFQTLIASIEQLTDDIIEYGISPGDSWLKYKDFSEKGQTLLESFFIGVHGVAGAAPEHVTVIGRRGTEEPGGSDKATE